MKPLYKFIVFPMQAKLVLLCFLGASLHGMQGQDSFKKDTFCGHVVNLDNQRRLLPPTVHADNVYDYFLRLRWNFVLHHSPMSPGPPPRSRYPQYYFYCAYVDQQGTLQPDLWMNDVGEKIPNWFESARLYYAYSGDIHPLSITKEMIDYALIHGMTPASYNWPGFPQTASDAGETEFRGFTTANRFSADDVQVDHAGDMGATLYRMFLFYGDVKYKKAAIQIANVLVKKIRPGNSVQSPWPYVVNTKSGKIVSDYGTNWFGALSLFDMLVEDHIDRFNTFNSMRNQVRKWILEYPVKNGLWVDGHSDNLTSGTRNLSNMSASNAALYISDNHNFDPNWKSTLPDLIKWTEVNFIEKSAPGEPSTMWGANLVSEQVDFMPKMDYQTARYAAQCARWYALSGDEAYKEKAYRSLNWVMYCNDSIGKVFESPVSKNVNSWWSDSYGECPRMIYPALAAIPTWAPSKENHILYSAGILHDIVYASNMVRYTATQRSGTEYLRLAFKPGRITLNGIPLGGADTNKTGYKLIALGQGDYALHINRNKSGKVIIMNQH